MTSIATTWGLSGPEFLWLYGALCAALAVAVVMARRRALGPAPRNMEQTPKLGIYEIAMLNGGAQLAITTALVKLHRDEVLRAGSSPRTHYVEGALPAQADRLERAVFDAVSRKAGVSTDELRTSLADSEPIGWMTKSLTESGLLVEPGDAQRLRGLWLWAAGLALLGVARIVAAVLDEAPLGYLTIAVVAVVCATVWIARQSPRATERGQAVVSAERERHEDVRRTPRASESVMAAALFGGGALWLADPAIASTLDVPREAESLGWGRGASSTVGTGCGGGYGGGGGWFGDGGGGGWFGGDGGGGSSCGGGGGGGCGGGGGG